MKEGGEVKIPFRSKFPHSSSFLSFIILLQYDFLRFDDHYYHYCYSKKLLAF